MSDGRGPARELRFDAKGVTMSWRLEVRVATAFAFAAAMANLLWRMEYNDVFRWGMAGPQLLAGYALYVGAAGATFRTRSDTGHLQHLTGAVSIRRRLRSTSRSTSYLRPPMRSSPTQLCRPIA